MAHGNANNVREDSDGNDRGNGTAFWCLAALYGNRANANIKQQTHNFCENPGLFWSDDGSQRNTSHQQNRVNDVGQYSDCLVSQLVRTDN